MGQNIVPTVARPNANRAWHVWRRPADERGRITILVLGLLVILIGVVAVTASASYVTTSQRKLLGLSDSAAESAAASFVVAAPADAPPAGPQQGGPTTQGGGALEVTPAAARAAVEDYLRQTGAAQQFEGLTIRSVSVADDGVTVRLTLGARVSLPLTGGLLAPTLTVQAESSARTGLSR